MAGGDDLWLRISSGECISNVETRWSTEWTADVKDNEEDPSSIAAAGESPFLFQLHLRRLQISCRWKNIL